MYAGVSSVVDCGAGTSSMVEADMFSMVGAGTSSIVDEAGTSSGVGIDSKSSEVIICSAGISRILMS